MKTRILATFLSATLATWAFAAETQPVDPSAPAEADAIAQEVPEQGQFEVLLAPIALYPDALVALILPAATHPSDIVLASRFLKSGGKEEEIDEQTWDDSVKALAHYPDIVTFMDENLAWTQDVGDAFVDHPAEVMGAVQSMRARAARNGLLASTPQQEVVFEDDDTIRIIPAEPEVIYVPYYEPSLLYYTDSYVYYPSSLVWFSVGFGIGSWLNYDCDWRHRSVWVTHHNYWNRDYDWRRRYHTDWRSHVGGNNWTCWQPSTSYRRHRPRGDYNYTRTTTRMTRPRFDTDRSRYEPRRDRSSAVSSDNRSIRRPETLRNPASVDRNDSNRTADIRRDRRPSDSLSRYKGETPVETVAAPESKKAAAAFKQRSLAPIHRAPDTTTSQRPPEITQRRPEVTQRRPEVTRSAPQRNNTARPTVSAAPQPRRTVTAAPPPSRPTRTVAPSPQVRHSPPTPTVRAAPRPAAMSRPSPAPARQAPAMTSRSESPSRSSSPARDSGGNGRRQNDEN